MTSNLPKLKESLRKSRSVHTALGSPRAPSLRFLTVKAMPPEHTREKYMEDVSKARVEQEKETAH
jgi:hypothetical protein